jgi:mRNA interferase YafQ
LQHRRPGQLQPPARTTGGQTENRAFHLRIAENCPNKRDHRKHRATLDADLLAAISFLATDQILPERFRDHPLTGEYTNHRECHLKPDLLLIYKKPDDSTLRLVRIGSHSEVF